jgi:hypothetical protein
MGVKDGTRPSRDSHDWPLYGDKYAEIKAGNLPTDGHKLLVKYLNLNFKLM